jgi:hypothetical protein
MREESECLAADCHAMRSVEAWKAPPGGDLVSYMLDTLKHPTITLAAEARDRRISTPSKSEARFMVIKYYISRVEEELGTGVLSIVRK